MKQDGCEDETKLVATGKMRLPRGRLELEAFWKIPTGSVRDSRAVEALLKDRAEGR